MRRSTGGWLTMGVAAAVLLAAGPAAAENGIYVGASVGRTSLSIDGLDLDLDGFDFSASDTSYKVVAGYRFMGFFAVEASWLDFGSPSDAFTDDLGETVRVEADLKGFDAVAVGMIPIGFVDLFGKAGVVVWDADIRTAFGAISQLETDSGSDVVLGLGAQVRFSGLAVRGEVEYFGVDAADSVYLVSVGATFTF